ncbi:efflux RND transporter periplasmic adaptor subunit, partial [Agriterribacter sp.]|uniref:efflux RND transporter periplasmic adaptor subunit n=1 Tax=Agriterribacter sp. TaxID=2821509 RepID=UPI002C6A12F1
QYEQDVRTAQANIKIAEANVNAAEMEVNKVRPLVEKNIISKYELESAEFSLQSRQAALAQARASLANARTNLGYTSPVNGVIGNLPYKIGSLVSSNTALPLTMVSNIDSLYAYFSINEKQALEFATTIKGATAAERLKSIPPVALVLATGMIFPEKGHIETASGLINTETGSVRVRATFPNPGSIVRSGSSGIVRIPARLDAAILVPQKSTYEIQGKKFVYLLDSAGTVKSVEIRIRENTGGQYFVVEEGLKPGDKIILEGVATLREGAPVIPREVNADSVFNRNGAGGE